MRSGRSLRFAWISLALLQVGAALGAAPVINEIMYHPPDDRDDLQYVELFNPGKAAVSLAGWSFNQGIRFAFSNEAVLNPGSYLVIARNRQAFRKHYGPEVPVLGDFGGKLGHRGEAVQLVDEQGRTMDRVVYSDRDSWPTGADGSSASLERICPYVAEAGPVNWAASALPATRRPAGTPGRQNDSFCASLPPVIGKVSFNKSSPGLETRVTAEIASSQELESARLFWRILGKEGESPKREVTLRRLEGDGHRGTYEGAIPGQPEGTVVRFHLEAGDGAGAVRLDPAPNEPRPAYSYATHLNTNSARIAFAYTVNGSQRNAAGRAQGRRMQPARQEPVRGESAFVYVPPNGGDTLLFDYVAIRPRPGGFKIHFTNKHPFKEMTSINVVFENSPRWLLSEPLSFELYQLAGVPAPQTEHARFWVDGRLIGYQLMIEQPNKSFLVRHHRKDDGHLYKMVWQGQGMVGQHEKKTRVAEGHTDLARVIEELQKSSGPKQWEAIRRNFNVEEFASYYAVSMAIQNWDGFWNNYFAYHDTGGTRQWEIYPWDEDKTWGYYDGVSPDCDWYDMPLTFGMNGDQPSAWSSLKAGRGGGGPHGGPNWWRRPGWFSGPMLANPEFRQRFLARLKELCQTTFTEEKMLPLINEMERRLEPEITVRAQALRRDPGQALQRFRDDIQSLRLQVKHRRAFVLSELERGGGRPRSVTGATPSPTIVHTSHLNWIWLPAALVLALLAGAAIFAISSALRPAARTVARPGSVPPVIPTATPPPLLPGRKPPPLPPQAPPRLGL